MCVFVRVRVCLCVCQVMARSSPRDKNMLVRRLNGSLPDNRETWEADHIGEEMTYDTPAELYTEVLGARVADVSDLRLRTDDASPPSGMIQDVVLPGYVKEWEKSRLVRARACLACQSDAATRYVMVCGVVWCGVVWCGVGGRLHVT
jgi:hypothetical protein